MADEKQIPDHPARPGWLEKDPDNPKTWRPNAKERKRRADEAAEDGTAASPPDPLSLRDEGENGDGTATAVAPVAQAPSPADDGDGADGNGDNDNGKDVSDDE